MTNPQGDIATLSGSQAELRMLEIALRAGKGTDPILRRTTDEETDALHNKIVTLIERMDGDTIEFPLSKSEFLNMSVIVGVVNTMDPEIYYRDMMEEFPPDDDLDDFAQHLEGLYDRAFGVG